MCLTLLHASLSTLVAALVVIAYVIIHPQGLHPMEAMRAWQLHREDGYSLTGVREKVHNIQGDTPSVKAVWSAIRRVDAMCSNDLLPSSGYSNCGRKPKLSEAEEQKVVAFVQQWRHKRFCTCAYIRTVLKLKVTPRCITGAASFGDRCPRRGDSRPRTSKSARHGSTNTSSTAASGGSRT